MPFPASARAANLQRLTYLLSRKVVESKIASLLTQYDVLQEQIEDALGDWLDALAKGELGQAEVLGRRLRRVLADGLAALPAQEQRAIADIAEMSAQAGAIAAELPRLVIEQPDVTLPQIVDRTTMQLVPGVRVSAGVAFVIGQEVRDAVTKHVYSDGLNLSARLHTRLAEQQEAFNRIISQGLAAGRSSVRLGQELARLNVTDPRFPKYLDELVKSVRSGDLLARDKALAAALKQAARRKQGPLGVKDAVDRLIDAVRKGNAKGIDKAITAFMEHKARYHAIVIARTEGAEAFREGFVKRAEQMPELVRGIRWQLSQSHPHRDICCRAGTLVETIQGAKPIETIAPGEYVLTHRGRWRPVTRCYRNTIPAGSLIELQFQAEQNRTLWLVVTPNHPVLTEQGWIPAGDLQTGCRGYGLPSGRHDRPTQPCGGVWGTALRGSGENAPSLREQIGVGARCGVGLCWGHRRSHTDLQGWPRPTPSPMSACGTCQCTCGHPSIGGSCRPSGLLIAETAPLLSVQTCQGGASRSWGCLPRVRKGRGTSCCSTSASHMPRTLCHTAGMFGAWTHAALGSTHWSSSACLAGSWGRRTPSRTFRNVLACGEGLPSTGWRTSWNRNATACSGLGALCVTAETESVGCTTRTVSAPWVDHSVLGGLAYINSNMNGPVWPQPTLIEKRILATLGEDVFNLAVAEDHSYFANGVAVHNCDVYATQDLYGLGPGVYPAKELPRVPHPNCLCFWQTVLHDKAADELEQAA